MQATIESISQELSLSSGVSQQRMTLLLPGGVRIVATISEEDMQRATQAFVINGGTAAAEATKHASADRAVRPEYAGDTFFGGDYAQSYLDAASSETRSPAQAIASGSLEVSWSPTTVSSLAEETSPPAMRFIGDDDDVGQL